MVDPAFISERVTLSEGTDSGGPITQDHQKKFEGFTFIPDDELDNKAKAWKLVGWNLCVHLAVPAFLLIVLGSLYPYNNRELCYCHITQYASFAFESLF